MSNYTTKINNLYDFASDPDNTEYQNKEITQSGATQLTEYIFGSDLGELSDDVAQAVEGMTVIEAYGYLSAVEEKLDTADGVSDDTIDLDTVLQNDTIETELARMAESYKQGENNDAPKLAEAGSDATDKKAINNAIDLAKENGLLVAGSEGLDKFKTLSDELFNQYGTQALPALGDLFDEIKALNGESDNAGYLLDKETQTSDPAVLKLLDEYKKLVGNPDTQNTAEELIKPQFEALAKKLLEDLGIGSITLLSQIHDAMENNKRGRASDEIKNFYSA